ncbi:protein of unknown function [Burkholderia multivorans]
MACSRAWSGMGEGGGWREDARERAAGGALRVWHRASVETMESLS